jgi:hypothetical protein
VHTSVYMPHVSVGFSPTPCILTKNQWWFRQSFHHLTNAY